MTREANRADPPGGGAAQAPPAEGAGTAGGLPRRVPAPVPRGPRPGPELAGPDPDEPGPIAALRRARNAVVPLERVRRALEELDEPDEQGEPSHGDDGRRGE